MNNPLYNFVEHKNLFYKQVSLSKVPCHIQQNTYYDFLIIVDSYAMQ